MRGYWNFQGGEWNSPLHAVAINSIRWEDTETKDNGSNKPKNNPSCNQFDPMRGYWNTAACSLSRLSSTELQSIRSDERILKRRDLHLCLCIQFSLQSIRSDERILKHIIIDAVENGRKSCNQFDPMRGYWNTSHLAKDRPPSLLVAINSIRWEDTETERETVLCCNDLSLQSIRSDERILKLLLFYAFKSFYFFVAINSIRWEDTETSAFNARDECFAELQSIRSDERILKHLLWVRANGRPLGCNQFDPMRGYWNWECARAQRGPQDRLQSIRSDERILKHVVGDVCLPLPGTGCNQFDPMRGYWNSTFVRQLNQLVRIPLQSIRSDERILKHFASWESPFAFLAVAINSIRWEDTETTAQNGRLRQTTSSCNQFDPMRGYWNSLVPNFLFFRGLRCNQFDPMRGYWNPEPGISGGGFSGVAINSIRWEDTETCDIAKHPFPTVSCNQFDPMRGYWNFYQSGSYNAIALCCNQFDPMRGYWNADVCGLIDLGSQLLQSIRSDERILKRSSLAGEAQPQRSLQSIRSDERILKLRSLLLACRPP